MFEKVAETYEKLDKSINNDFEKELVDNGYKWFFDSYKNSIRGFQKRIRDEYGTKYFINGYHYNHSKQIGRISGLQEQDTYCFECQFLIEEKKKHQVVNLGFSADFLPHKFSKKLTTLKEVEDFYEKAWNNMMADYYEYNSDISDLDKRKILTNRRLKNN
jgi:hypothetical protein